MTTGTLLDELENRGYLARIVPIDRIDDLRDSIESHHLEGELDERFWGELSGCFVFEAPEEMGRVRSLMVVSERDPIVKLTFRWKGRDVALSVPPTYLHGLKKEQDLQDTINGLLEPGGHRAKRVRVPRKLLAVRSGLAEYGRNNITYVPGWGSFHRLAVLCSDLPCDDGEWTPPAMMECCEDCSLCIDACPTGAISEGRFLLRAELCITEWNEQPRGTGFPAWLESSWHNCLVGCMHCQMVCPKNREVMGFTEDGPVFSEEETRQLLRGLPITEQPPELAAKLERWDLAYWLELMPRNLGVHLPD